MEVNGNNNWNQGAFPLNSPDVIYLGTIFDKSIQPYFLKPVKNFDTLANYLADGPVYGYYIGKSNDNKTTAHLIVITGAVSAPGHENLVTSNNPWGDQNIQTYSDFCARIPNDPKYNLKFKGILRVEK